MSEVKQAIAEYLRAEPFITEPGLVDRFERLGYVSLEFGPDVTVYAEESFGGSVFRVNINWRSSSARASVEEAREMTDQLTTAIGVAERLDKIIEGATS